MRNELNDRHSDLRVLRWSDRISNAIQGFPNGPIRANLDLDNRCTHKCYFCEPAAYRDDTIRDKRHTLDTGIALRTLHELADLDCRAVNFSGGGEPTLHPDFGHVLNHAHDLGMRTFVITHGGLIDRWHEALLQGADHVRISLDASNSAEHAKMHHAKAGEFEKIKASVEALAKARGEDARPEIGIAYILTDFNSSPESLIRLCDWASDTGIDFIHFRPISEDGGKHTLTTDSDMLMEYCEGLQADYPRLKIWALGKRGKDIFHQREFEKCYAAMTLAVIGANGDVQACCDQRGYIFGNLYKNSFREIWLSDEHRQKAHAIEPKLCGRCIQCGYNRAVQQLVIENRALPELL